MPINNLEMKIDKQHIVDTISELTPSIDDVSAYGQCYLFGYNDAIEHVIYTIKQLNN